MKHILFVSAGRDFPNGAFRFLRSLQEHEPVFVTGLFFCPAEIEALATASQIPIPGPYLHIKDRQQHTVNKHKYIFTQLCEELHIKHHLHPNTEEFQKEVCSRATRFADLTILSGELFCSDVNDEQPNGFLREALYAAESPVMVVPENYEPIQRLIIGYDGGKESLHAIKQFVYLLPQYTDLPADCVYVKEESSHDIPDLDALKCYSRLHFASMNFSKLQFRAARFFATWIGEQRNCMMISGSFGRTPFSYLAKKSFSEAIVHDHSMPLFIAHT